MKIHTFFSIRPPPSSAAAPGDEGAGEAETGDGGGDDAGRTGKGNDA